MIPRCPRVYADVGYVLANEMNLNLCVDKIREELRLSYERYSDGESPINGTKTF